MSLAKLDGLISRLKSIPSKSSEILSRSIEKNKEAWEELQRKRISSGKNTKDDNLKYNKSRSTAINQSDPYVPSYERIRRREGLQTDHVDLKRTGKYQRLITAKTPGKNKLKFESNDPKAEFIEGNYDDVLGFTDDEKKIVFNQVGSDLRSGIRKIITS